MRVTIVPEECSVTIDGELAIIEMPVIDTSIHAVQWYGTNGTIEHKDTTITNAVVLTHVEEITKLSPFQEIINIATAKIAADKIIAAEKEIATSEMITAHARAERDFRLLQSDWTQLSDNMLSNAQKEQWKEYRQTLRDITLQPGFPNNIVWPEKPE